MTTPCAEPGEAASSLLDASTDCVKALSLEGALMSMNPEGQCLMEIDDFQPLAGAEWWSLWPEQHRPTLQAAVARAAAGSVARFSADCPTAKGTLKHWDVVVSPVHEPGGRLVSLLAISRDVTREVHVAGQRSLVLRELAHRVKNLFAVIDGMVNGSARAAPQHRHFADGVRERISSLGRAVSYIYGDDIGAPVQGRTFHGLIGELVQPYVVTRGGLALEIGGEDVPLSQTSITPFALMFNELATNALKYGALARPGGSVSLAAARRGDAYEIRWTERGAEGVVAPASSGFGSMLLDRTVGLQLGGTIERDWRPEGLDVTIRVPADRL